MSSQENTKWPKEQLGELGHLMNGINKSAADFGFGIPFVNLLDVFGVSSISEPPKGLVNASNSEAVRYKLDIGDVLFIRSSVKPTGVGLSTVVDADLHGTIFCGFIIRFRSEDGKFDNGFLKYIFHGSEFRRQLLAKSTVSANANINQESLKTLWVDVPPLPEQRKIARILTTLDNLIEKTEALIAKYQSIKQGMMHDLFTRGVDESGRLRPTHEQAPDLYKQSSVRFHVSILDTHSKTKSLQKQVGRSYVLRIFTAQISLIGDSLDAPKKHGRSWRATCCFRGLELHRQLMRTSILASLLY